MPDYRRYFVPRGTYFFTLVTERRAPLFAIPAAQRLLGSVMRRCLLRYPLDIVAVVLLPEHRHTLWALPTGDDRYPLRRPLLAGLGSRSGPRRRSRRCGRMSTRREVSERRQARGA